MNFVATIFKKSFLKMLVFLLVFLAFLQPAFSQEQNIKHILIVNSYHNGFSWTDNQVSAAKDVLLRSFGTVELYYEYMDT
ncbi:MAG: hypothetical protein KKF78_10360, partial [Candidatus Omnitrophica bacterium]|nr:hypothetical protein [Candidatus Omnitrophota bacterium]MBU1997543.1 hypothetical protein [Candidatus Omnitrophota bacterium]